MVGRPKAQNSESAKEMDRVEKQFEAFDANVKEMTMDNMNKAPKRETEEQTKISARDIEKSKEIWLKPVRSFGPGVCPKTGRKETFNEDYREEYNYQKEYVQFIAENLEIIGETIKLALKKFPGTNIDHWEVPVNVPVWGPRMLAERLADCGYSVLSMENKSTGMDEKGNSYYGTLTVSHKKQRLNARPVSSKKSFSMSSNF